MGHSETTGLQGWKRSGKQGKGFTLISPSTLPSPPLCLSKGSNIWHILRQTGDASGLTSLINVALKCTWNQGKPSSVYMYVVFGCVCVCFCVFMSSVSFRGDWVAALSLGTFLSPKHPTHHMCHHMNLHHLPL